MMLLLPGITSSGVSQIIIKFFVATNACLDNDEAYSFVLKLTIQMKILQLTFQYIALMRMTEHGILEQFTVRHSLIQRMIFDIRHRPPAIGDI
jgi:hypothetical protein